MPSVLIDKDALVKKYAERAKNPLRVFEGTFQVDKFATAEQKKKVGQAKLRDFIVTMEKRHWKLASRDVRTQGPFPAHDLDINLLLPTKEEYRVRAVFKYAGPTPGRNIIEVPESAMKDGPDDYVDVTTQKGLKQALRRI